MVAGPEGFGGRKEERKVETAWQGGRMRL